MVVGGGMGDSNSVLAFFPIGTLPAGKIYGHTEQAEIKSDKPPSSEFRLVRSLTDK